MSPPRASVSQPQPRIVKTYDYCDEHGELLYQCVRYEPKDFRFRRPDGKGDWIWKLGDVRRVLYRLPALLMEIDAGDPIFLVEGERDAGAIDQAGWPATCNPGGAGAWRDEYAEPFAGHHDVRIIRDKDKAGRDWAAKVRASLERVGARVRVFEAAVGNDVSDHLAASKGIEDLINVTEEAPPETLRLDQVGLTGSSLRDLTERPISASPLPGLMDPEPGLHALIGQNQSGKTTFALHVATAWAAGCSPWMSAPSLLGSRVLVLSNEQNKSRVVTRVRRLIDGRALEVPFDHWENLVVIGKDCRDDLARRLRRLDTVGIDALREGLIHARDQEQKPYGLVVLDSLGRLKPSNLSEQSNDDMVAFLDPLHQLAIDLDVYIVLIHHQGHDTSRGASRSGRGATAIGDCTVAQWVLTQKRGHHAELAIDGNDVLPRTLVFRISDDSDDKGVIRRFQLEDTVGQRKPQAKPLDLRDHVEVGEEFSQKELARRIRAAARPNEDVPKKPGGSYEAQARASIQAAEEERIVERSDKVYRRKK
jgi:hypothetical protein